MTRDELRARRAALGMTQAQLAAALGVQRLAVARWEAGARTPAGRMLDLALRQLEEHMDLYATLRTPPKAEPQRAEFTLHTLTDAGWHRQAFLTEEAALAARDRSNAGDVIRAAWVDQNGMEIDPLNRYRVEDPSLRPS